MPTAEAIIRISAENLIGGALSTAETGFRNLGQSVTKVGQDLLPISIALGAIVTAAITTAANFEAELTKMALAAGDTGTDINQLRDYALKMGADTMFSANEAATAMTGLFKAGFDANDIMGDMTGTTGLLRAAMDLAAASGIDVASAADAIAVAIATYGLSAEDATNITNNFVKAADASTASVQDLIDAHANVGPTARSFGLSIEDLNTALAIMSDRGIRGAEAGTALKSMLTNLNRPTTEVKEALDGLGISLFDAEGAARPLETIIGELSVAMGGLTDEQRTQVAQTIAGTYGMQALNALVQGGLPGWKEMETKITAASDAQTIANANMGTFKGTLETLKGALETLLISAATPFIENFLKPAVTWLTSVVDKLSKTDPQLLSLGIAIAAVGAAAAPVLLGLGAMATAIGALLSPIGLVVVAVAALAVGYATNFGGIRTKTDEVIGALMPQFEATKTWLETNLPSALATLKTGWDIALPGMQTVTENVFGVISTTFGDVAADVIPTLQASFELVTGWVAENLPLMQQTVETVSRAISSVWAEVHDEVKLVVDTVWNNIKTSIDLALNLIMGSIETIMYIINGDWDNAWKTIRETVSIVWDDIKTVIASSMLAILDLLGIHLIDLERNINATWNRVKAGVDTWWYTIKKTVIDFVQELKDGAKAKIDEFETALSATWDSIWGTITIKWAEMVNTIVGFVQAFKEDSAAKLEEFKTALADAWDSIRETVETEWSVIKEWVLAKLTAIGADIALKASEYKATLETAWIQVKETLQTKWDEIKTAAESKFNSIKTAIETFIADFIAMFSGINLVDIGAAIMEGLRSGIQSRVQSIMDSITGAVGSIIQAGKDALGIGSPSKVFMELGQNMMQGMAIGIVAEGPNVKGALEEALQAIFDLNLNLEDMEQAKQIIEELQALKEALDFRNLLADWTDEVKGKVGARIAVLGAVVMMVVTEMNRIAQEGPALTEAAQILAKAFPDVTKALEAANELRNSLSDWTDEVKNKVAARVAVLASVIGIVSVEMNRVAQDSGTQLSDAAARLAVAIPPAIEAMQDASKLRNALADWTSDVRGQAAARIAVLASVISLVSVELNRVAQDSGTQLSDAAAKLAAAIPPAIAAMVEVNELRNALETWSQEVPGRVAGRVAVLGAVISLVSVELNRLANDHGNQLTDSAVRLSQAIPPAIKAMQDAHALRNALADWTDEVKGKVEARVAVLGAVIGLTGQTINEVGQWYGVDLTTAAVNIAMNIPKVLTAMAEALKLREALASWGEDMAGGRALDNFKTFLHDLADAIHEARVQYETAVVGDLLSLIETMLRLQSLINSFVSPIAVNPGAFGPGRGGFTLAGVSLAAPTGMVGTATSFFNYGSITVTAPADDLPALLDALQYAVQQG